MKLKNAKTDHNFFLVNDDIFDTAYNIIKQNINTTIIIPHVCNNVNAFGAGFADNLSQRYPSAKANFHVNGAQKLGHTQFVEVDNVKSNKIIVANMIAQNGLIGFKNKRPLHYPSLMKCMYEVKRFYQNISNQKEVQVEIHAPKFGSGLAGGNWLFIGDLIDDIWNDINTYIYTPKNKA